MDSRKPHAPLSDANTARNAAKGQHRIGWYMVAGGVFVIIALVFWLNKLERQAPAAVQDHGPGKQQVLDPDGPERPGLAQGVAFGDEKCVPWHVSAASDIPPPAAHILVVTSRLVDPYAYTAAGFRKECGGRTGKILVAEDLKPGQLIAMVSEVKPDAVLAVGKSSLDMVRSQVPGQKLLYAMVEAPGKSDLDHPGFAGVIPAVPVRVAVRRMVNTLPRKAKKIAVIYAKGRFSSLGRVALDELKSLGRSGLGIQIESIADLDSKVNNELVDVKTLIVLIDGLVIDDKCLGRIMVIAENDKIPVCVSDERHVMRGAYVGIGVDSFRVGQQLCHLAGALVRGEIPGGGGIFCPEYSFAVLNNAVIEKLGYMLDPEQFRQIKLYKWN